MRAVYRVAVQPIVGQYLHKFYSTEGIHITSRELKPFSAFAFVLETIMPVFLNPYWVIRLDLVNEFELLWKQDFELEFPSLGTFAPADFKVLS